MKIFVILFSIFFWCSCMAAQEDCDIAAKKLFPGSNIETIEASASVVYRIDQDFYVFCDRYAGQLKIERAYNGSWKNMYCARLDPTYRCDVEEFKKYKCGPEKE